MKAFFLLVLLVLVFFAIAASSLAQVDLTPDTPAMVQQDAQTSFAPQPQVIQLQESDSLSIQQIPVTGACTDPYVVQPGDNLSSIAVICNTTVGEIRLANPEITNINMIYVGQALNMPDSAVVQVPVPVTGLDESLMGKDAYVFPTPIPTASSSELPVPVTGTVQIIRPGTVLRVTADNYPPNTPVSIGIMPENGPVTVLSIGVTDEQGRIMTSITLPAINDLRTMRVVIVATAGDGVPLVQAVSDPFFIGEAP